MTWGRKLERLWCWVAHRRHWQHTTGLGWYGWWCSGCGFTFFVDWDDWAKKHFRP